MRRATRSTCSACWSTSTSPSPSALGVTGISYGGGQSIELAYLKNRIRLPDGEFAPWTSPERGEAWKSPRPSRAGRGLTWSNALLPNGRFLDSEIAPPGQSREPIGVEIQSYVTGLYALGQAERLHRARRALTRKPNSTKWYALTNAGEPYTLEVEGDRQPALHLPPGLRTARQTCADAARERLDRRPVPARTVAARLQRGPCPEGLRGAEVGDLGHSRGSNKENTDHAFNEEAARFFEAKLKHTGTAPASGSVTAYTQTCPVTAPGARPVHVASELAEAPPPHGHLRLLRAAEPDLRRRQPAIAAELDPILLGEEPESAGACTTVKAETEPDTANYTMVSKGFTLMGMPTVTATIKTLGPFGELASRLWDVLPDGEQRLVSRGVYRLTENQTGHDHLPTARQRL